MSVDWYLNTTWDDAIERAFDERLRRSWKKEPYLRIQASTLARSHPEIALTLLKRYFDLHDDFDHAQAHVDCATALLALGRVEEAHSTYEAALSRKSIFPKLKTQAYLDLLYVVATRGIHKQYSRALEVLVLQQVAPDVPR